MSVCVYERARPAHTHMHICMHCGTNARWWFSLHFQPSKMKGPSGAYSQSVLIVWLIKTQSSPDTAERTQRLFSPFSLSRRWWQITLSFFQPLLRWRQMGWLDWFLWHVEIPADEFSCFEPFDFLILGKLTSGSDPEWVWWYLLALRRRDETTEMKASSTNMISD